MIEILDLTKGDVIAVKAEGKITNEDYEKLTPVIEKTEREGKSLKLLVETGDMDGMTPQAVLTDISTFIKHAKHIQKMAVVGDSRVEESLVNLSDKLTKTTVKYFSPGSKVIAEDWIKS